MSKTIGNDGRILVGSNVVAEVQSFEFTEGSNVAQGAALSDSYVQNKVGTKTIQGSLSCWYDPSDTNGQESLTVGAEVTLNLRPEGTGSGNVENQISAVITEVGEASPLDEYETREISFVGNSLTRTTQ